MTVSRISISRNQYLEFEKIALGAFAPLTGFMREPEFQSVVENLRLPTGQVFPLPVVFDLSREQAKDVKSVSKIVLVLDNEEVGEIVPESVYSYNKETVAKSVFGTTDPRHPGVAQFLTMGDFFVGGPIKLYRRVRFSFSSHELTPEETRAYFAKKEWRTVVGFQTRNVPHRAHEYLLRLALEMADGLFIQPLVGTRKRGDYLPEAILTGYQALIKDFLPQDRILLGVLSASMRYAGPREAIFHALVRRNYGCTHFIVGRDHAGVGGYYGTYEAHELTQRYENDLGIQILRFHGPFHCSRCGGIYTDRTCPMFSHHPK